MSRWACRGTPTSISPPSLTAKAQVRSLLALLVQEYESTDTDEKAQPSLRALSTTRCKRARKLSCQKAGGSRYFFFFMIGSSGPVASSRKKKEPVLHMSLKRRLQIGWKQEGNLIHPVVLTGVTADMR